MHTYTQRDKQIVIVRSTKRPSFACVYVCVEMRQSEREKGYTYRICFGFVSGTHKETTAATRECKEKEEDTHTQKREKNTKITVSHHNTGPNTRYARHKPNN